MPEPIVGIVLAAGTSSRLGRPKQLEVIARKPLVVHTVERVLQSMLDTVIVVTGAEADQIRETLADLPIVIVENPAFASGQASSVVAGVRQADAGGADAVIFLLADQPGISPTAIDALIDARRAGRAPVGMARYGARSSHPVLFGRELFPELLELRGDLGGREIVQRHRDALVLVDGGRDSVPADLDRDDDLDAVRRDLLGE